MHLVKHLAAAAVLLGIAGLSTTASAGRIYSTVGNGCVPVDEDVQVDNYDSRGFGVGFKGNATGDIRLSCNIPNPPSTFRKFVLSYIDPDGGFGSSRVTATLREAVDGTNISTPICSVSSNSSSTTGHTTISCNFTDFTPRADTSYFFEVVVARTSSGLDPEFLALSLLDNN